MRDVLHIRRATAIFGPDDAALSALLEAHRDTLPRGRGRRMNPLGLAIDLAMGDDTPQPDEPIVYASRYAMSRTLEDFLTSFPHPSPLAFQNAIHPAGVEQYLVPRKLRIGELVPVATAPETGLAPVFRTLFMTPGDTRRIIGGEERATWLGELDAGADETFAFTLTVSKDAGPGTIGTLAREPFAGEPETPTARAFSAAIARRENVVTAVPGFGRFTLAWL